MRKEFNKEELIFLIAMGLVLGMRELSMTMLNPFIRIYGLTLKGNTIFLCGLALGIYGLTNAIFQIPYGIISDRKGRKPIILIGLLQLILGFLLSYVTSNIYIFILARALQGSGAIMAIAYSWLGDVIDDDKKSRAMGIAGTIVAIGAVAAFGIGPILYKAISLKNMFLGCAFILLCAWFFILLFLKEDRKIEDAEKSTGIFELLKDKQLIRLSVCGFIFNYVMSEMFFLVPTFLDKTIGAGNMWMVFTPGVLCGIIFMIFASSRADNGHFKQVSMLAFVVLAIGSASIVIKTVYFNTVGVILIFSGFMILTSGIPSAVNKIVQKNNRGSANGILQTLTFLGFFVGPTLTGFLIGRISEWQLQLIPIILSVLGIILIKRNN
ncbi:Predicted arabinose efflux permease, MFS family [Clostridium acidisoli DSM 12555]|uniref:Predicted arabinose efflux permease, MFS family n=1 Tax=Clostridium acidisoli DSM 12555 TaxID=1121291 RepID=A0A1W1WX59_9CLOT|nr:MFS transporter [Clostridium acidisoli]SMC16312.1 Predicted arabinose efflux permease, MFS family [Clostridium acidisoli DSM 12555]